MTYPQGPYGRGFPGRPGRTPAAGLSQGYPPQPVYQQGYLRPVVMRAVTVNAEIRGFSWHVRSQAVSVS